MGGLPTDEAPAATGTGTRGSPADPQGLGWPAVGDPDGGLLPPAARSARVDLAIALVIAAVSIATALVAWRGVAVGSSAADASRRELIEAVKVTSAANNDWRRTYQEAAFARTYAAYTAEADALAGSGATGGVVQSEIIREALLPGFTAITPLAGDPTYQTSEGTPDLEKRFLELQAMAPDLSEIDPDESGRLADRLYAQQRWLAVVVIVLTFTLFWLTVAEITRSRLRLIALLAGSTVFALGLAAYVAVELVFGGSGGSP